MICDLMFDVIFIAPDGTETVLEGWTCAENMGYPYYEATLGNLKFLPAKTRGRSMVSEGCKYGNSL